MPPLYLLAMVMAIGVSVLLATAGIASLVWPAIGIRLHRLYVALKLPLGSNPELCSQSSGMLAAEWIDPDVGASGGSRYDRGMPIVALVRDLMFSSKLTATARALGVEVVVARDPAAIPAGGLLLVDLNQPAALEGAVAWKHAQAGRRVVGFVSHVDTETIAKARAAGVDSVLARSAFVRQLPEILRTEA